MKKFAFLILAFITIFLNSCKDEATTYEGDPYLHFNKEVKGEAVVKSGTGSTTVNIEFGTVTPLSGPAQVKLVVDKTVSTAIEGTDFQILNQDLTVAAGQTTAQFQVKLLEATATVDPKLIVFRLQSASVANTTFAQTYTLTYNKACPASAFFGSGIFKNTVANYNAPNTNYTIQDLGVVGGVGTMKIVGFRALGGDLTLNYNPDTFVVTVPDQYMQYDSNGGQEWVKNASDGSKSTFNACTRTLKLRVEYYVKNPVTGASIGTFGDYDELFVGQ